LSLAVLADPFWGRLPWLLKRRGGKHSKHKKFSRQFIRTLSCATQVALVCAQGALGDVTFKIF
jgi:hypothetical protein